MISLVVVPLFAVLVLPLLWVIRRGRVRRLSERRFAHKPLHRIAMLITMIAFLVTLPACAALGPALAAALPIITQIVTGIEDASQIVSYVHQASESWFVDHPNPDLHAKVEHKIAEVRLALSALARAGNGAEKLDQKKVAAALADFQTAYADLEQLLVEVGILNGGKLTAAKGAPAIVVPKPVLCTMKVAQ
jgi:hypothetical protein